MAEDGREEYAGGSDDNSGWTGAIQKTAAGVEKLMIFMAGYTEAVPFGSAVSIVVSHIQEARALQKLATEKEERMVASIRRTEKTLLQMEENQITDKSKHKPVQNLLGEYAKLLGRVDGLCKAWNRLNCIQQFCYSSTYNEEFEELTELLQSLKADLTMSAIAKMDAEATLNFLETKSVILAVDDAAASRHRETEMKLNEASAVQQETLVLLKELVENSVTTNAMTLEMTTTWDTIMGFDWTAQTKGLSDDACRAISIGLVDKPDCPQMMLMQFFDTEESYNHSQFRASSNGRIGGQRPTWAMIMKASDMKTVRAVFVKEKATEPVLIHEEPILEGQDWWARAWWVPSHKDGCLGIRLAVKCAHESNPTVHHILVALQGDFFRKVGAPTNETVRVDLSEQRVKNFTAAKARNPALVSRQAKGLEKPLVFPREKKSIKTDYQAEGDSFLELEIDGKGGTTYQNQASNPNTSLHQHLVSGKITLRNQSDQEIVIRSARTEARDATSADFQESNFTPDYYTRQPTYVGFYKGSFMNWGIPHPEVEWIQEGQEFTIKAHDKVEIVVKCIWVLEKCKAYNGKPLNMRLHATMEDPVTVRVTFFEASGKQKSICWDIANEVMQGRNFASYGELLLLPAERDSSILEWQECPWKGIGNDYQCDLWMQVDDPETLNRYYIVVTSAKDNPAQWVIRAANTPAKFPSSYNNIRIPDLERLAFEAKRNGTPVVEETSWSYDPKHCKVRVLVDLELQIAYALECEITLYDGAIVLKDSMYLDCERFV